MSTATHTRPHPARPGSVDIRLPWWAIALPTITFAALLLLILNPADAHAAGGAGVGQILARIQQAVLHTAP
ncbi:hypothetical protein [Streptomyces sp. NPDC046821]|uniref:hypothetical protein n=1 Tax=Streptomyces sp. NPDC046821 TaxID=3154702 RepID=UPI0033DA1BC7